MVLLLSGALLTGGCSQIRYLGHTAKGQWQLMRQREPIDTVLADDTTDPELSRRLETVLEVRRFAVSDLQLPDNDSYTLYAETGRQAATWTVQAAPALSLEPVEWCFPIAGCVPYRGYFRQEMATDFAAGLAEDGLDVAVIPALAYSTLGYFADPVLDTMLRYRDARLAEIIFHELAHQKLYVAGDAAFNESFATFIGDLGVQRWLRARDDEAAVGQWMELNHQRQAVLDLISRYRKRLQTLYASNRGETDKRHRKTELLDALRQDFLSMGLAGDYSGHWLAEGANNAHLAALQNYQGGVCAFERLWQNSAMDLSVFYERAERLAADETTRQHWLATACDEPAAGVDPPREL